MKVLIFGGRDFQNKIMMMNAMNNFYLSNGPITCVIHGDAKGADSMGKMLARNWLEIPDIPFPADWKNIDVPGAVVKTNAHGQYNAVAGHMRNQKMIDEGKPDWGMCFPGGSGTADMKDRLIRAGIPVWDGSQSGPAHNDL